MYMYILFSLCSFKVDQWTTFHQCLTRMAILWMMFLVNQTFLTSTPHSVTYSRAIQPSKCMIQGLQWRWVTNCWELWQLAVPIWVGWATCSVWQCIIRLTWSSMVVHGTYKCSDWTTHINWMSTLLGCKKHGTCSAHVCVKVMPWMLHVMPSCLSYKRGGFVIDSNRHAQIVKINT